MPREPNSSSAPVSRWSTSIVGLMTRPQSSMTGPRRIFTVPVDTSTSTVPTCVPPDHPLLVTHSALRRRWPQGVVESGGKVRRVQPCLHGDLREGDRLLGDALGHHNTVHHLQVGRADLQQITGDGQERVSQTG